MIYLFGLYLKIKTNMLKRTVFFLFLVLSSLTVVAQAGIKVGYVANFHSNHQLNSLLTAFNTQDKDLDSEFKPYSFSNGMIVGARIDFSPIFINVDWSPSFHTNKSIINEADNTTTTRSLSTNNQIFSTGLEYSESWYSIGVNYNFSRLKISQKVDSGSRSELLKDNVFSITPFISLNFLNGDRVSAMLKPFVEIPLGKRYGLDRLADELDITNPTGQKRKPSFGISFIVLN